MTYYILNQNNGVCPKIGGTAALSDASVEELRVLLCVLERGALASDATAELSDLAACSQARARAALRYWCECGVLVESAEAVKQNVAAPPSDQIAVGRGLAPAASGANQASVGEGFPLPPTAEKKALRPSGEAADLPASEVAKSVRDRALASFIEAAEQTVGRVFNLRELNILTALVDTTPFSEEYLLTLIGYCKTKTKRFSFGYLEKTAHSMLERECLTLDDLNAYLSMIERVTSEEWKLRRLFGFGERRLSPREREYFERWVGKYGYTVEIIGIAYDITVNNTGKIALAYMDKLITRFHENGCRDVAAVEALLEKERAEQAEKPTSRHTGAPKSPKKGRDTTFHTGLSAGGSATEGSSFVASDFLSAALRRSYGDDGEDEK